MTHDAAFAREYQKKISFIAHLGLVTEELGEGTAHGGIIMTLLDVALCTAARTLHPDSSGVMTIDMSTSFIGAGSGPRLVAEARVLRNGRSIIFTEGEARNEDGSLVAKAIGTVRARKG